MHGLAVVLLWATILGHLERNSAKVARLASHLIELSTRQNFAFWLAGGGILRGWACSASGDTAESISWVKNGIADWRATGSTLVVPYYLGLKAEALHFADRTSEALEAILARLKHWPKDQRSAGGVPNCTGSALSFSRLWALTRAKLRLRSAPQSESQKSKSPFR